MTGLEMVDNRIEVGPDGSEFSTLVYYSGDHPSQSVRVREYRTGLPEMLNMEQISMKRIMTVALICLGSFLGCAAQQIREVKANPADSGETKQGEYPAESFSSLMSLTLREPLDQFSDTRNLVPASYYVDHLGFFCKKELQVQSLTGLPLKFRLGSVEYTDHLEGKDR